MFLDVFIFLYQRMRLVLELVRATTGIIYIYIYKIYICIQIPSVYVKCNYYHINKAKGLHDFLLFVV